MIPKRLVKNQFQNEIRQQNNGNISIVDWDSPSYCTGTVKRRPTSLDGGSDEVSPQDDDHSDKSIETAAKIEKSKSTCLPSKVSFLPRKITSKKGILKPPPYRNPPPPPLSSSSSSSSSSSVTSPPAIDSKKQPPLKKTVRIEDSNKTNHHIIVKESKTISAKRARRKTIFIQAEIKKLIQPPEIVRSEENNYILFHTNNKMAVNNNHKVAAANDNEHEIKEGECDILTKPEFSSDLFKNLPVRQRKGAVSHMENYCLFDPSVDFINEKELKLKMKQQQQMMVEKADNAINSLSIISVDEDELIEEIIYEDQMVCDPLIHQEEYGDDELTINNDPSSNYFIIDPNLCSDLLRSSHSSPQLDNNPCKFTPPPLPPTPNRTKSYKTVPLESMNRNFAGTNSSGAISQRNSKLNTPLMRRNNTNNLRKNIQRPLSNHSDADSGFLSPATPPPDTIMRNNANNLDTEHQPQFNAAAFSVLEQCDSIQGYIEIYTDWANYYLDRAKSKKKVTDLSSDCKDGLLLAEVIEAVTTFKVPDLIKKPKTQQQMYDNVNSCLNTLRTHCVCGLDTITTAEICAGRLKAILALFFALSRYKQASKQQKHITSVSASNKQLLLNSPPHQIPQPYPHLQYQQNLPATGVNAVSTVVDMTNRQLPAPYTSKSGQNGGTSIPLPATVLVTRRSQPDKVRPLPPTPGQISGLTKQNGSGNGGISSEDNSRPGSPPVNNHHVLSSQIPKGGGNNGIRQPPTGLKMPSSPYGNTNGNNNSMIPNGGVNSGTTTINSTTKHSMLEKLKLFNSSKDKSGSDSKSKQQNNTTTASQISKRTSSSSGFSSARSERSDSSLSLNNDAVNHIVSTNQNSKSTKGSKESKSSSKSSVSTKLLSSTVSSKNNSNSSSKITSTNKTDKQSKDKSPMRNAKVNSPPSISNSSSIQSLTKNETKLKMPAATSTPIGMKNGNGGGQKISQVTAVNSTGIPKPMAAIKGTSKIPHDRLTIQKDDSMEFVKEQKVLNNNNNNNHNINNNNSNSNSTSNNHNNNSISNSEPISNEQIHAINNAIRQTNIVNPTILQNQTSNISLSDSQNSTGLNSNSSESSVIYRPSSESGASDITNSSMGGGMPNRTNHGNNNNNNSMKMIAAANQRKLMEHMSANDPLKMLNDQLMNSQNAAAINKFNTIPTNTKIIPNTIYEEDHKNQMTIMPMRPILRGYTSHVTLPTRGLRGQHNMVADYYDDIGQGYCSDGDALRKTTIRYSDIDNGYLSEGGLSREGKHYLSILRGRTLLPTTIEERCRNSRGENLDSVGLNNPPAMESNGLNHSNSHHRDSSRSRSERRDQWSKYTDPHHHNHHNGHQTPPSPTSSNHSNGRSKEKGSPSHARRSTSTSKLSSTSGGSNSNISSSRNKTVPQNFGYIKQQQQQRSSNGGSGTPPIPSNDTQQLPTGRTVHVSAVQRSNKIKVSGGTQTCASDMQTKVSQNPQHRSFSLTGPGATQLSQSIRERLSTGSHSLPKPGTEMHVFQHRFTNRGSPKINDGSLSDTQTYAEVKPDYSSYAMWLKHSNTATSRLSAESDGLENISIASSGGGGGSNSSTGGIPRNLKFLQHRESTHSPRLNRSNSIRSTKSEKMYPSMLSRAPDMEIEPYYCLPVGSIQQTTSVPWSQPTSPTPPSRGFGGLLSPTHGNYRLTYPKKNDDVHGSAASLLSGGSSLYGSVEERQANEMRRLKRELLDAKDQVMSLSSQLSTNAHVVAAFEQSLTSMTGRLQHLTANAEKKDSELTELRQTIERLRKSSIQAGLTSAHMQSMGVQSNNTQLMQPTNHHGSDHNNSSSSNNTNNQHHNNSNSTNATGNGSMQRHHSTDSMCSLNSLSSGCSAQDKKKKKGWLRSSFTKAFSRNAKISKTNRHISGGGHHQSNSSNTHDADRTNTSATIQSANNSTINESHLPPASPNKSPHKIVTLVENAKPVDAIDEGNNNPVVEELKKQLREKDLVLTDIRLEALSSASQLETLKDTVMRMRAEMMNLKQNNERLQKLVTSRSLAGSEVSLGAIGNSGSGGGGRDSSCGGSTSGGGPVSPNGSVNGGEPRRFSLVDGLSRPPLELPKSLDETEEEDIPPAPAPDSLTSLSPTTHVDLTPPPKLDVHPVGEILSSTQVVEETGDTDGKRIAIAVYIGQPESFLRYAEEMNECDNYYVNTNLDNIDNLENGYDNNYHNHHHSQHYLHQQNPYEFIIAFTYISGKTTWQNLDYIVRKTFKDYLAKIDPGTNLGLNTDSITSYHLGDAKRGPEMGFPELLPCGYIVGNVRTLYICLQGVGSLAFDSLIPKSIVHRYISLLNEHRRLILCGPSGTGKSYLARKLAEFLVARSGRGNITEAIACFNVDHKSSKELRQYLTHIVEQASMANGVSELPSIIILDNLHHTSGDVFSCLTGPVQKLPCIIGIMSQATCNTTNLQLHHNFRWVLTANHMEPVKGFLGRFLRRRLYQLELSTSTPQSQLASVFAWLPTVWQHINRFLETHSSSDVTIGPRLFLSCPLDIKDSQVWFTDVWNYHLAPYLVEAVREGVQLYGRRGGAWVDPSTYIKESYPWPQPPSAVAPLRQITAEDVGLESDPPDDNETQDPLLNMLLRLQEAANYADKDGQESDCASLDSNITQDSSAGAE